MLPILLVPMAAAWAGITLASQSAYQMQAIDPVIPFSGAAVCVLVLTLGFRKRRNALQSSSSNPEEHPKKADTKTRHLAARLTIPPLTALVFCLALGLGSQFYGSLTQQIERVGELKGVVDLVVIEDTQFYPRSRGSEAMVYFSDGSEARVRIYWNDTSLALPKGSHLKARVTYTPLRSDQRWLFDKGCIGTLSISEIECLGFSTDLWGQIDSFRYNNVQRIEAVEGDGAALLAGVLLGNRERLRDSAIEQDFRTCGLAHLIAVSGTHLAIVAALLAWFLRRLPLGRKSEVCILVSILVLYVVLTGMQPSAIRSGIMAGIAAFSVFTGRRGHAPSALTTAAVLMMLVYPANAYSLGFWLSVCSVVGITLFAHLTSHWVATAGVLKREESPGGLSQTLAFTLVAMAATLPIAIPAFAVLSLVSPLANLIAGPLFTLALGFGVVALVLIPLFEPLGLLLLNAAVLFSDLCALLASIIARVPFASTPLELSLAFGSVLGIATAALVYFLWPTPKAKTLRLGATALIVATMVVILVFPHTTSPRLIVMDVGQGDAILVQEQGSAILIDTGASGSALVHALARNNVRSLKAVVITHLDNDHAGALTRLRGLVPVENVYFAQGLLEHQSHNEFLLQAQALVGAGEVRELTQGDVLQVGRTISLVVLWPERVATEGSNAESICLLLQYDVDADGVPEHQALLTGDCEHEELAAMLRRFPGLQVSVLKVGHHGSRNAMIPAQVHALDCRVALISVGVNNSYGHPSLVILDALAEADVRVMRTDEQGDLACLFNGPTMNLRYATMKQEPY
ncbi:MAG: DNA internalization-related competence protein ComEC/Rec2 [Coriobacteriia bacterium]|nr:DNA internalization-related competence protein ComEC/Rec2 [Coriobacteriia bacterium]